MTRSNSKAISNKVSRDIQTFKHKDKINRVTFWGLNDGNSWKNDWPINGRTDYPLLFDRENQPKQAFDSIIALKP
nr:endo-1,4-beta-xylanase [Tamlana nanhaiensis]